MYFHQNLYNLLSQTNPKCFWKCLYYISFFFFLSKNEKERWTIQEDTEDCLSFKVKAELLFETDRNTTYFVYFITYFGSLGTKLVFG